MCAVMETVLQYLLIGNIDCVSDESQIEREEWSRLGQAIIDTFATHCVWISQSDHFRSPSRRRTVTASGNRQQCLSQSGQSFGNVEVSRGCSSQHHRQVGSSCGEPSVVEQYLPSSIRFFDEKVSAIHR
jgi:hypothetical protein